MVHPQFLYWFWANLTIDPQNKWGFEPSTPSSVVSPLVICCAVKPTACTVFRWHANSHTVHNACDSSACIIICYSVVRYSENNIHSVYHIPAFESIFNVLVEWRLYAQCEMDGRQYHTITYCDMVTIRRYNVYEEVEFSNISKCWYITKLASKCQKTERIIIGYKMFSVRNSNRLLV